MRCAISFPTKNDAFFAISAIFSDKNGVFPPFPPFFQKSYVVGGFGGLGPRPGQLSFRSSKTASAPAVLALMSSGR